MSSSQALFEQLADAVWRSWAPLGLAASARPDDRRPLDPEALVVMSFALGADEPRLLGEVLDWLCANGELVSLGRLRNARRRLGVEEAVFETYVDWVARHGGPRWKPRGSYGSAPTPSVRSGKSVPPNVQHPAALAFRLRRICGVGIHAEVLRALLAADAGMTVGAITAHVGYASRNVADILAGLDETGLLLSRADGRRRLYSLDREAWRTLTGGDVAPLELPWLDLYDAALRLLAHRRYEPSHVQVKRSRDLGLAEWFAAKDRFIPLPKPTPENAEMLLDHVAVFVRSQITPA